MYKRTIKENQYLLLGIIGKPNVGKSTFFNAATLMNVAVANYPFTTITPNIGVGYIRVKCVHEELGVTDNPVNSACVSGTRLIPVRIVDVAGLVPDASSGRGLGNKFLDDLRQADALIHVIDASGSTDEEGRPVAPGSHDPLKDLEFINKELVSWVKSILQRDWQKISRAAESSGSSGVKIETALLEKLSGLSISESSIEEAIHRSGLKPERPTTWNSEDILKFCRNLLAISKPILIAANKCDQASSKEIISKLQEASSSQEIVPCAAEAELMLRRAAQAGLINYVPGDSTFEMIDPSKISDPQKKALEFVRTHVLDFWKGTGVQKAINNAYLNLLKGIVVYPVEDETKLTDKKGNVLPDARIMHVGDTAKDLAFAIHSDLGNSFLYAIDARTGLRVGADYKLRNNDVLKVVATSKKG
jgi:ribosome-binding ATPase YchF (GTP1/OBG family)